MPATIMLDGRSLSIADVVAVARHGVPVAIAPHSLGAVSASRRTGEGAAGAALRANRLRPITLEAKEGLAFVNGTQAQTGMAALLVHDAWVLWRTAHAAAAMSLEAVRGTPEPFDARIHDARPHPLQQRSAALLRGLLAGSEIRESHRENDLRVQDAYSLRCTPQVLGAVGEALAFAERLVTTELNAATDNPLVLDRKSTRLNSSHSQISYAVFCLKKKN